jgi:hypothetical protein
VLPAHYRYGTVMTVAQVDDESEQPTGYGWHRGWSSIEPDSEGFARVGGIMVPAAFEIHAFRTDSVGSYTFSAVLAYEVQDGELRLRSIQSTTHEIDQAVRILQRVNPWDEWKRFSLMELAAKAEEQAGGSPEDVGRGIRAAHGKPVRRTRTRVTDSMLQEVAEVYRLAWESGKPPTLAVRKHFHKSQSTAARWVGMARERGYLGKADGTRGGEASKQDQEGESI